MSWEAEQSIASDEARRRASVAGEVRRKKYELALRMRQEGHTKEEITERTGLTASMLNKLLRGHWRRS